ncbi:uncharacterized protein FOBCDRAFT_214333 [Fusarium oxysporum Fo47]|uniref:uncharacterized protein n=1 Tax=Fusarium oxysporum Fo47 TaxID=660027 RepID=UPI00286987F6|nr:uncharacterized protein FOBCDRAFT_214333 [Fusarium oxysporum Fo47]WJG34661.1 hypothetical protein FOBCDRAFT_214333 [Fusarium oxysporum Fo47]
MPKHLPLLVGAIRCLSLTLSRQLFYLPVSSLGFVAAVVSKNPTTRRLAPPFTGKRTQLSLLSCPSLRSLDEFPLT